MKKFDVLCTGMMVADIIAKPVDASVFGKDSVNVDSISYSTGGDALNVAINLSKLGFKAAICGVVGNDIAGGYLTEAAAACGVDISYTKKTDRAATSTSIVLCEPSGERHFVYCGKGSDELVEEMIPDLSMESSKLLFVGSSMALKGLDGDGLTRLFKRARRLGVTTAMDATNDSSGRWIKNIEGALPLTDIFFPSYAEAVMITGECELSGMRDFMSGYGTGIFGVKLGAEGCYITDFKKEYSVPAFYCADAEKVDTTGAGDAFMSGFLCGVLRGWDIYKCAVFGNAISNFCIRKAGTTTNTPDFDTAVSFARSGYSDLFIAE